MEVTLKTKDGSISFKFGLGFLGEMIEETGLETTELLAKLQTNPFKYIPIFMYYSTKYYSVRKGEDFTKTQNDIIDIIDNEGGMESKMFTEFMAAFSRSMTKDVPKETPQQSIESKNVKK